MRRIVAALLLAALSGCDRASKPEPSQPSSAKPVSSSGGSPARPSDAAHPHVVLISLCSVRADHLGCYGYSRATSPHIDAFGKQAVVFDHAVTPWPKTTPSFCSVMTGLWPHETGVMRTTPNQRLDDAIVTLAERLKSAGYRTAAFTTTPGVNITTNLNQGFEIYEESWRSMDQRLAAAESGLTWLREHRSEPCLLWVHFNNAHYPYSPAPRYRDLFVDDEHYDATQKVRPHTRDMPIKLPADHPAPGPVRRPDLGGVHDKALIPEAGLDPERLKQRDFYVARYDGALRTADEQVGLVLDGLSAAIGDAPCIVVLWADHGESMGEHNYYFEHGRFAYETCAHVPFVLQYRARWPQPRRVSEPVSTVDMAATVAALAGAATDGLSGVALAEVIDGKKPRGDVYFSAGYHPDFITGVRRGRWKLHHLSNKLDQQMALGVPFELYDLDADPMETKNLAADQAEMVKQLDAALSEWKKPWWSRVSAQAAGAETGYDPQTRKQLKELGYLND